jgi:SWI/SNF-related matrix-associated actin-dependent regulator 1 of chromatin subfamily A
MEVEMSAMMAEPLQAPLIAQPQFVVSLTDAGYRLAFPYDPVLVSAVRALPQRHWDKAAKCWTVPRSGAEALAAMLARIKAPIEYGPGAQETMAACICAARASREASRRTSADIDLPVPDGLAYLPYQRAGIAFALDRPGVLIADEMGLGKTIQAIGVCNADASLKSILILCPASLRLNWMREWQKWDVHRRTVSIALSRRLPNTDVVICNYDIVKNNITAIHARQWDALICDEAHYLKNYKAQRSKLVLGNKKENVAPIKALRRILLTGTPILNRPIEAWTLVSALAPQEFNSWYQYANRYCAMNDSGYGKDVGGASHLDELQDRLRATIMVRRLKAEVLTELPPKRRQVIELSSNTPEVAAEQAAWQAMQARIHALRVAVQLAKGGTDEEYKAAVEALKAGASTAFTELSKLRHMVALAKVPEVIAHLTDSVESGKVICFAHHRDVVAKIAAEFPDCVTITGDTPLIQRQAAVDRFQTDPTCRLIIGNLTAMGVGFTLTASSHVVFAELDWVPGVITQAEDRAHRIGQRGNVLVQHLVLEGSLDSVMARRLVAKQEVIDRALDSTERSEVLAEPIIPMAPREEAATESVSQKRIAEEASRMAPEQIAAIHNGLRMLAGMCDGAVVLDGMGFNRIDTEIGHSLAAWPTLTGRQAALGLRIITKYRRQLPSTLLAAAKGVEL